MEYYGYAGRILHVDLTNEKVWSEPLDLNLVRKFVGGPGLGYAIFSKLSKPGTDPLSPENPIIIATGPLVGTLAPGSGKCCLITKFPVVASKYKEKYCIGASTGGSRRFAVMLKNAGYDCIVVVGKAEKPSYLKVTDEGVEICNAKNIWGKDVYEATDLLIKEHEGITGKCGVWVIGRAGENLVRVSHGFVDGLNTLGRYAGAVAGAKNLKAIVTLGSRGIKVADRKRFMEAYKRAMEKITKFPQYQPLPPPFVSKYGELYIKTRKYVKGCSACIGPCKSVHEARDGEFLGETFQGTVFDIAIDFGKRLRLSDYSKMFKLIDIVNRNGLCLLTTLRMLYYVTRLYERGIISRSETGGLPLKTGDFHAYVRLVEKMVRREDIGALMAEGWYPLCEKLGVDASADFRDGCSIIKGIDTLIDARLWPSNFNAGMGLANIVSARAKHVHLATYWPKTILSLDDVKRDCERMGLTESELERIFKGESIDHGRLLKYAEDAETLYNALGTCSVSVHWAFDPVRDVPMLTEFYVATTGFDVSPRELLKAGERIRNLERLLNVAEGFTREDDEIPAVWLQNIEIPVRLSTGDKYLMDWSERKLSKQDIEEMTRSYYEERGWDYVTGMPTKEKLAELGLTEYYNLFFKE